MADLALFFGQAFTVAMVIALLVMALSVFFNGLPRRGQKRKEFVLKSATELFEEGRHYDVLLSSGQRLLALRFEGVVRADAEAGWPLSQFAVMRRSDGGKVILRIESVRAFEEVTTPHGDG
jgi:hypothetical protein